MTTSAHRRRHATHIAGLAAAIVLMFAGCGTDEPDVTDPTDTHEPTLTAPPTTSPEDEAKAELELTFKELIEGLDAYYQNASDFGGEQGWNATLVGERPVLGQAELDITNWVGAHAVSELEQVGETKISTHVISDVQLPADGVGTASSVACLDKSGITYQTYDGAVADLPIPAPKYQTWTMTWSFYAAVEPEAGIEEPGWYVQTVDVALDHPC